MNNREIYDLLGKYYEGQCSDEEEQTLVKYFRDENVPAEFETEKEIFFHYHSSGAVPMPDEGFEHRIMSAIDTSVRTHRPEHKRKYIYTLLSAAATILLLAGSWFFFLRKTEPADTFKDPALAYNETLKVLYDVSAKLNTGMTAMESARRAGLSAANNIDRIGKSTGMINEKLKSLSYFRKAMVIVSSPFETRSFSK